MPGRGPQFWPFSVQIVPDQKSRYVPGNAGFTGFSKVLYRTLVYGAILHDGRVRSRKKRVNVWNVL